MKLNRRNALALFVSGAGFAACKDESKAQDEAKKATPPIDFDKAKHANQNPEELVSKDISFTGLVKNQLRLTVDDLIKLPVEIVKSEKMQCLSGADVGEIKDFKGVLLRDLLTKAEIIAPQHNDVKKIVIIAKATDGYMVVFSWSEIFNNPIGDGVIIYFERDGMPLDVGEGEIAMVSRTDIKSGGRHVKWLKEISVFKVA